MELGKAVSGDGCGRPGGPAWEASCVPNTPDTGRGAALVENYSYLLCPDCGKRISVFGESHVDEAAEELGLSVLGKMPIDAGLAEAVEQERFYEVSNEYLSAAVNKL